MHGVSRLWVIGFDIADVLFVPGVYASTGLYYILLITRVTFQAVNTTRVCFLKLLVLISFHYFEWCGSMPVKLQK